MGIIQMIMGGGAGGIDPREHFDVKLYTGNGDSSNAQTGLNFSPDFAWLKPRSAAYSHNLYDTIRGDNKRLVSNANSAEQTAGFEFQSNGFDPTGSNDNGTTYVTWAWDAGDAANPTSISAGDYNSSTYNQSQTWSTAGTASGTTWAPAVSTLFNGDISDGPSVWPSGNDGTWTFTSPPTASSSIKIYCVNASGSERSGTTGTYIKLTVSGTDHIINAAAGLMDTGLTGTLDAINITVQSGSGSPGLKYVEIDGKLLVDDTVTINSPSIASEYKANPTAGFSIVSYDATGSDLTVGHGLNTEPALILLKSRNVSGDWLVMHKSAGVTSFLKLNEPNSVVSASNVFISASSTTFGTGDDSGINSNNQEKIAYCWSEVEGFSKFGSFASGSNPFVYLGFRPKFILFKASGTTGNWDIYDTSRSLYNEANLTIPANIDQAEYDAGVNGIDILSNGFKCDGGQNVSTTYVYAAWAESPTKYSNAR